MLHMLEFQGREVERVQSCLEHRVSLEATMGHWISLPMVTNMGLASGLTVSHRSPICMIWDIWTSIAIAYDMARASLKEPNRQTFCLRLKNDR